MYGRVCMYNITVGEIVCVYGMALTLDMVLCQLKRQQYWNYFRPFGIACYCKEYMWTTKFRNQNQSILCQDSHVTWWTKDTVWEVQFILRFINISSGTPSFIFYWLFHKQQKIIYYDAPGAIGPSSSRRQMTATLLHSILNIRLHNTLVLKWIISWCMM